MKLPRMIPLTFIFLLVGGTSKAIASDYFETHWNAGIPGHNTEVLKGVGVESGKAECLKRDWCRSFDVRKSDGTVYLQDVNQSDRGVGGLRRDYPGHPYDHYERIYNRHD